jgi:phosphoglycolate phosphatase
LTLHNQRMYLPDTFIEIIKPNCDRAAIRCAVFDFDGTVSLIREGWQAVMLKMSVDVLKATPHAEDEAALRAVVTNFVARLTGRPTIYQMVELAEEVKRRGGQAKTPEAYKSDYLALLDTHIEQRLARLRRGQATPADLTVPGVIEMLAALRSQNITCYLASGTDEPHVIAEAQALGVADYFNGGIYAARDDGQTVSKKMLITRLVAVGNELVVFGDGYDEIEHAAAAGCLAIGVASNEAERQGVDEIKRQMLVEVGADIIIPDFRERMALLLYLGLDAV